MLFNHKKCIGCARFNDCPIRGMSEKFRALAFGPFDHDEYKCYQKTKPQPKEEPKPAPTHKDDNADILAEMKYLERLYRLEHSRIKMAPEMRKPVFRACLN